MEQINWQPIKTAKENERVILSVYLKSNNSIKKVMFNCYLIDGIWYEGFNNEGKIEFSPILSFEPYAWMPTPEPAVIEKKGGEK